MQTLKDLCVPHLFFWKEELVLMNMQRYVANEGLKNLVDPELGY